MPNTKSLILQGGSVDVHILGEIHVDWGFSAVELQGILSEAGPNAPVNVHISSSGGSVIEGMNIYNVLRSHKGKVTTINTSLAGSMASIIFLAGDERKMFDNALLMIHNAAMTASGDKEDIKEIVKLLEKVGSNIVDIYASRTGQSKAQVETWLGERRDIFFNAEESLKFGFATELIEALDAVAQVDLEQLVAKLQKRNSKESTMDKLFKEWLVALGFDKPEDIDKKVLDNLKAKYDKETLDLLTAKGKTNFITPTSPSSQGDILSLEARRKADAEEVRRVDAIRAYALKKSDVSLSEDGLKDIGTGITDMSSLSAHAIEEGWTVDKFELTSRRIEQADIGSFAVHNAPSNNISENLNALSCALCRESGMTANKETNGVKHGYENAFDEKTLEASDAPALKNLGLLQTLDMFHTQANGYRYNGRLNTDGFISACRTSMHKLRATGNTSWGGLNIFDDVANKLLWDAFNDTNTTWQQWVTTVSVNDFKTHNMYRLTPKQGYLKVGADGELKHGGFTDDKYTVAANTFGKITGLSRRDIINDDLNALSSIMSGLGREGARFLEEMFYVHLQNQSTTLFPTAGTNNNYQTGAATDLGVDGLTTAETLFRDQVDGDGAPIMVEPSILIVGNQDAVLAKELFTQGILQGLQSANTKKRPDQNPHVGKFTPVVSGYLSNDAILQRTDSIAGLGNAIPNQTTDHWFMLAAPNQSVGGVVIGAFLNGSKTPTVESGDPAFDVLGLQWRAYHDAGVGNGDPKLGVQSSGSA